MQTLKWIVIILGLIEGGWLTFDGAHAFMTGDFVTPSSGDHAGELGPWSTLVSAVGIEPRSALMKSIHVVLGLALLISAIGYALHAHWAWTAMMTCAVLSLWYLPFGTIIGAVQIIVLMLPSLRR